MKADKESLRVSNGINASGMGIFRHNESNIQSSNMKSSGWLLFVLVLVSNSTFRFRVDGFEPVTGGIRQRLEGCKADKQATSNLHFRKVGTSISHSGYIHLGKSS